VTTAQAASPDAVVIGSGLGGLSAAAMLSYYGKRALVLESHYAVGGAAHGFERKDKDGNVYKFETGPSFFAGLSETGGLNPLPGMLGVLGVPPLEVVSYDPLGAFHVKSGEPPLLRHAAFDLWLNQVQRFSPAAAEQVRASIPKLREMHTSLRGLPVAALRGDLWAAPIIAGRYLTPLAALGPYAALVNGPTSKLIEWLGWRDPFLKRLIDLECFLLSGVDAAGTIAAEFVSVFGESDALRCSEFPVGGAPAMAEALVAGLKKHGGDVRLNAHVEEILIDGNKRACGVRLKGGEEIRSPLVVSNASVWDTYGKLLPKSAGVAPAKRAEELATPACESFMHLHLGIDAKGLDLDAVGGGHHVVVLDEQAPITQPGNVCMISIASVWDPTLAPEGHHCVHAYTLEDFEGWSRGEGYAERKEAKLQTLWRALETVIPDVRSRVRLELGATPLSHERWLRRHKGTYGPAIRADEGKLFPGPGTPVEGLWRVGDSVAPGIGAPAVVGSGLLCANTLSSFPQHWQMLDKYEELAAANN